MNRKTQILGSLAESMRPTQQTTLKTLVKSSVARTLAAAWAIGLLCLTMSGCGQKGPLYLPTPAASATTSPNITSK